MRGEATNRVLLGRRSPGCPAEVFAAVGTIWGASKLGGRNITEYLQPRKRACEKSLFAGQTREADPCLFGERCKHTVYRRGTGSSIQGKVLRITSGSCRGQQWTGNNLQGLSKRGQKPKEERAQRERRMSRYER